MESLGQNHQPIRISLIAHRQADPDALCSAGALALLVLRAFSDFSIEHRVIAPQGASALGVAVCNELEINFVEKEADDFILKSDVVVALDMGQPELMEPYLGAFTGSKAYKILIDHHGGHASVGEALFDEVLRESSATSTCELLTSKIPDSLIDETVARILLTGIMFDSQHLGIATAQTLETVLRLVRKGATIESTRSILRAKPSRSEIIARAKSAQRLRFSEIGKYIVMEAEVSSFQASVARMMLEIGADLGIAYGRSEGETRISMRSSQLFFKETAIDLGAELRALASQAQTTGESASAGGHSTAASLTGTKTDPAVVAKMIIDVLKSKLP